VQELKDERRLAEIDDRLTGLIQTALASPLAPLATRALARIGEAEDIIADSDDAFAPFADKTDDRRALRQLKVLGAVIGGTLALELELFERSLGLAREIDDGLRRGERSTERFATVMLVDPTVDARPDADASPSAGVNLLTGRRREVLRRTLDAWNNAVEAVASSIPRDAEGELGDR
jgi:hypothetical protein